MSLLFALRFVFLILLVAAAGWLAWRTASRDAR